MSLSFSVPSPLSFPPTSPLSPISLCSPPRSRQMGRLWVGVWSCWRLRVFFSPQSTKCCSLCELCLYNILRSRPYYVDNVCCSIYDININWSEYCRPPGWTWTQTKKTQPHTGADHAEILYTHCNRDDTQTEEWPTHESGEKMHKYTASPSVTRLLQDLLTKHCPFIVWITHRPATESCAVTH